MLVVPLDPASNLLAVGQHDDHGSLRGHLLQVVVALGVGLLGRSLLALLEGASRVALGKLREVWPDQFSVARSFVFGTEGAARRRDAVRHGCFSGRSEERRVG